VTERSRTRHRLGFAVKVLGDGGLPSHDTRRWQSGPHLDVSLDRLEAILARLEATDVRMYRMPSSLAPYASHPELDQFHGQAEECAERLAAVGERAREAGVRLSFHPGQYTVLNSETEATRAAAVAELEVHAALLDAMGAPREAVVVLHVGGGAGGTSAGIERFLAGFERLSERARARLAIENDDRTYDLTDVLSLSDRAGLPVVWDALHHRCVDRAGIPDAEALSLALATWPEGVTPKIHYSSPRLDVEERMKKVGRRVHRSLVLPQLRAHADLIDPIGFEHFIRDAARGGADFDVMLEAKAKDLALRRLREQMAARGLSWSGGRLEVPSTGRAKPG
jgi:UV DNA damage endonuclease